MRLHVGQSSLQGSIARYPFDLLEVAVADNTPRAATLRSWREADSKRVFSMRLPLDVVVPGPASEATLARALGAAECLAAEWMLLQTSPTTTPTPRNRDRLRVLADHLRSERRRIAWEPRGVWDADEAEQWAADLGVTLVRDLSRDPAPAGDVQYTRLRALGFGTRVGPGVAERVAEQLESASEAFVIIEGQGAKRASQLLRDLLEAE